MVDELSAFAAARDERRNGLAVVTPSERLTFADVGTRVASAARRLSSLGIERGARVSFPGASGVDAVITFLAVAELGAVAVLTHPRLTSFESDALIERSRVDLRLDAAALVDLARADAGLVAPVASAPASPEDPLAIVFTSGTSGVPKGAILPRRAFVASARASERNLAFGPGDGWISSLALAHVGGLGAITKAMVSGGAVLLEPKFDPEAALARIARGEATLLSAVPTMLDALLELDREGVLARLRAVLLGGAPASSTLLERCAARRVLALTTYGLTEACSQVTTQAPRDPASIEPGSGRALPGVELVIRREDDSSCGPGEAGRIAVRGPTMMLGYDGGAPLAGFFDTGDLGELDDGGRLFVHARRSDLILTGGENVYPAEVEQVLEAIDGVRRAVVFGVPDARWGQLVAAAVELGDGGNLGEVMARASERLASHKRPRVAAAVARVELGPTGKVDRRGAADRYRDRLAPVSRR